jgi:hypothetical protein
VWACMDLGRNDTDLKGKMRGNPLHLEILGGREKVREFGT